MADEQPAGTGPVDLVLGPLPEIDKGRMLGYDAIRYVPGYPSVYVQQYARDYAAQEVARAVAAERQALGAAADRYEVVRRMNVQQFQDAYVLNRRTGKPFDEIISDLAPFVGLRVRA